MIIKGKDLFLYVLVAGQPNAFLHATDCTLKTSADLLETTTKLSGTAKTFDYANKYTWTLDINGLCEILDPSSFYSIQLALQQSTKLDFIFTDSQDISYSGRILVTDTSMDSPFNAAASFQGTFQGDGQYTVQANVGPPTPIGYAVQIRDQFGNLIANVPAPGTYNVLRFDTIDEGNSMPQTRNLIIMEGE